MRKKYKVRRNKFGLGERGVTMVIYVPLKLKEALKGIPRDRIIQHLSRLVKLEEEKKSTLHIY